MSKVDTGAIQYYKDLAFHAVNLSEEEEIALFEERKTASPERVKEINNRLVLSVIKLANELALRYAAKIPGIDIKDAIQEANEAAIDALRLYNPDTRSKNGNRVRFSTYAHYRIEFLVKEYIMYNSRLVRLPRGKLDNVFKIIDAIESLPAESSIEELTEKVNNLGINMNVEEVYKSLELLQGVHSSLDQTVKNESVGKDQSLKDIIPVPEDTPNQEEELSRKEGVNYFNAEVEGILQPYNDMTYEIIFYRFLDPEVPSGRTYAQTAKILFDRGITGKVLSKEWIRQLESVALERLRDQAPELKEIL